MKSGVSGLVAAHRFCANNRPALQKDSACGCSYCLKVFSPKQIENYIEGGSGCDGLGTAVCPYCGIDAVIGESAGYPLTRDFLLRMKQYWFECEEKSKG